MTKGFSDLQLKALLANPPAMRQELKDDKVDGLMLRVGPRGRPTWTYRFRIRGAGGTTGRGTELNGTRYHRVSLGTYPAVSIKAARAKAGLYAEAVERGENPIEALEERAVDRRDTVAALIDDYLGHAEQTMRSARNARWVLDRHMRPKWELMPAGAVKERDARKLVADVQKGDEEDQKVGRLKNGAAAEVRKWGSMLFEWARRSGRTKSNPFRDVPAPKLERRQRFLPMDEAKAVWAASQQLPYPWGEAIRLLMLTGCREMEICGARRAWYDGNATILIPPEHYKSGRDFLVALSLEAKAIVDGLPKFNGGDFLLSTTNGEKAIAGVARKTLDQLQTKAEKLLKRPMKRFSLHDLRRTVRTHLSRLNVSEVVAELVLGHALANLSARYNVYGFEDEKREALQKWAKELTVIGDQHG
jgi:integrase